MSKRDRRRVVLNDFKAKKQQEGAIEIETDDGTFTVPPPPLWSDEVLGLAATNPVGASRALMGDEEYDKFKAAGGSAAVLMAIIEEEHGETVGE